MRMNHPFTIIIPTRERAETLQHTIRSCLAQDYDNLQILVSDNASADNTRDVVLSANDARIRYINPGRRVSMMENFEFAFSHVTQGYVLSLGDDDALTRNSVNQANQIINETSTQALISDFSHYFWPNVNGPAAGQLIYSRKKGYGARKCKPDLHQVLYGRRAFNHLPCVYYGYINAKVLTQLRQMHGKLFASNIVDLFSSVALSLLLDDYVFSHEPLAINGTSNRSNGAAFMQISQDSGEKNLWFRENSTTSLPPFQTTGSIKMMLAEACQAMLQMNSPLCRDFQPNMRLMLEQSHLDVQLYKKSNIDAKLVEEISATLGFPNLKPNQLQTLMAFAGLYLNRLPKFINSEIIDTRKLDVRNVEDASELLQKQLSEPASSSFEKISLLYHRFKATR